MKTKKITIWVFSVSKVQDVSILNSEKFKNIQKILSEKYNIEIQIPKNSFWEIQWVSPRERANQIHDLFKDDDINILWAMTGGSASNEVLEYLDFELLRKHNKSIIGYSDTTILLNALYHNTGKVNFLWPHIKTLLKDLPWVNNSLDYLAKAIWEQKKTMSLKNFTSIYDIWTWEEIEKLWIKVLKEGKSKAIWIWWNLSSIALLVDTTYLSSLENKILLIEECDEFSIWIIRRNLFRLRHAKWFQKLQWVIFWHINQACLRDYNYSLEETIKDVFYDIDIPIIMHAWHGHILPVETLPIGWEYIINTYNSTFSINY